MYKKRILALCMTTLMAFLLTSCNQPLPSEYNYDDFSEYIKLCDYKSIQADPVDTTVTQAQINEYINEQLEKQATTKDVTSGTVTKTSTVVVDYVGKIDGVAFEGGSASNNEITIANGGYIDGFLESMIGAKVGDTVTAKCVFPDDYHQKSLAGQSAVFTIKINALRVTIVPEYTEAWVKQYTNYDTKADFEKHIVEYYSEQNKEAAKVQQRLNLLEKIADASTVLKYPKKEYKLRYNELVDYYEDYAEQYNVDLETLITEVLDKDVAEFYDELKNQARLTVKHELVLHAIAQAEGIEISKKEYNDYLALNDITNAYHQLLYEKVMDNLLK